MGRLLFRNIICLVVVCTILCNTAISQITNYKAIISSDSITTISFNQDFTNSNGAVFNSNSLLYNYENWSNSGQFFPNKSKVLFLGLSSDSAVLNGTSISEFYQFEINKSYLTLNQKMLIQNNADFQLGIIESDSTNLFVVDSGATVSAVSDSSHVSGPVQKIGITAFTFPVGNGTFYRPIGTSAPANPISITAQYFWSIPPSAALIAPGIDHVSQLEYWSVSNLDNDFVTLSWNTESLVADLVSLLVTRWDGSQWVSLGNGGTTGTSDDGTIVSNVAAPSEKLFTLGTTSNNNPLPVELLYFNATANEYQRNVALEWATATEVNSDYFVVERSVNAIEWNMILTQSAAGNSSIIINYEDIDNEPLKGLSYYRLKQVDFDGTFAYSNIEPVLFEYRDEFFYVAYPNPFESNISIKVPMRLVESTSIVINNAIGQQVYSSEIDDITKTKEVNLSQVSAGLYFLHIRDKTGAVIWQTEIIKY